MCGIADFNDLLFELEPLPKPRCSTLPKKGINNSTTDSQVSLRGAVARVDRSVARLPKQIAVVFVWPCCR